MTAGPAHDPGSDAADAATDDAPLRVMLVDDQALVRSGFALILSVEGDIQVVAEAADGRQAVAKAAALRRSASVMRTSGAGSTWPS